MEQFPLAYCVFTNVAAAGNITMDNQYTLESDQVAEDSGRELDQLSILGVDHIAIAVSDLSAAINWYKDNFAFRVIERRITRGEHTAMISAVLKGGAATLVLVQGTTPESQVSKFVQHFGCGVQHLALQVNDLDAAIQRLSGTGGVIETPIIADKGIRQVFLRRDDSGVRIELIERRGGDFTDQSVERLFRVFEAKELY
jgi:4-hydroxyphenylpyruvate dioxygenase-like putative hemolysin